MANLSDLPTELVERILDLSPNCESRLTLRRTCKNLCAKTLRSFRLEYFTDLKWTLSAANVRPKLQLFQSLFQSAEVVSHLTSLKLVAPQRAHNHGNIWVAKDIDPAKLATAMSQFTQLRTLELDGFSHPKLHDSEASTFVRQFSQHFKAPMLATLRLTYMEAAQPDVTRLITNHANTLTQLDFHHVNLHWIESQKHGKRPRCHSPWSDLFLAIRCLNNNCEVRINNVYDDGIDTYLGPPAALGEWRTKDCGVTITMKTWDNDDGTIKVFKGESIWEHIIYIKGNSKWRKGLEMLSAFCLADVLYYHQHRVEEADLDAALKDDAGDDIWQTLVEKLLNEKEQRMKA